MEKNTKFSTVVALWKADKRRYVKRSTYATISTTLNLYVHPNLEQKRKCIETMGKLIG